MSWRVQTPPYKVLVDEAVEKSFYKILVTRLGEEEAIVAFREFLQMFSSTVVP